MANSSDVLLGASVRIKDYEYLFASDTNVSSFVSVKLSGTCNYLLWKEQMMCLLDSNNMCGIVDATFVVRHDSGLSRRYDSLVRGWIFGSVTEDVLVDVYNLGSAKAVWETLKSIYDPTVCSQEVEHTKKMVVPFLLKRFPDNLWDEIDKLEYSHIHNPYFTRSQLIRQRLVKVEQWVNHTAESCAITAAIITAIVFAAGMRTSLFEKPNTTTAPVFILSVSASTASLFASTTAIVVFLCILTAQFDEKDFLVSLPRRLFIGLFFLFLSTTAMMVSCSAILFLVFCDQKPWTLAPICGLAFIPIAFVAMQFPVMVDLFKSTCLGIFGKHRKGHAVRDFRSSNNISEATFNQETTLKKEKLPMDSDFGTEMGKSSNPLLSASARIQHNEFLFASNTNVSSFVSVKLSGSHNYLLWKAQMIYMLDRQNVCGIVDSTFGGPRYSGTETMRRYDSLVRGWIFGSVSEDVLVDVFHLGSAKAVWDKLKFIYDPSQCLPEGIANGFIKKKERSTVSTKVPDNQCNELDMLEQKKIVKEIFIKWPSLLTLAKTNALEEDTDSFEEKVGFKNKINLGEATIKGDWSDIEFILKEDEGLATKEARNDEQNIQNRDTGGSRSLHIAAIAGKNNAADFLVKKNKGLLLFLNRHLETTVLLKALDGGQKAAFQSSFAVLVDPGAKIAFNLWEIFAKQYGASTMRLHGDFPYSSKDIIKTQESLNEEHVIGEGGKLLYKQSMDAGCILLRRLVKLNEGFETDLFKDCGSSKYIYFVNLRRCCNSPTSKLIFYDNLVGGSLDDALHGTLTGMIRGELPYLSNYIIKMLESLNEDLVIGEDGFGKTYKLPMTVAFSTILFLVFSDQLPWTLAPICGLSFTQMALFVGLQLPHERIQCVPSYLLIFGKHRKHNAVSNFKTSNKSQLVYRTVLHMTTETGTTREKSSNPFLSASAGLQEIEYLYASNTNVSNFVSDKLFGSRNYLLWKSQMIFLLASKNVFGIVYSTFGGLRYSGTENKRQCDILVRDWIFGSLSEDILADVFHLSSAKAVWEKLKFIFDPTLCLRKVRYIKKKEWSNVPMSLLDNISDELDVLEQKKGDGQIILKSPETIHMRDDCGNEIVESAIVQRNADTQYSENKTSETGTNESDVGYHDSVIIQSKVTPLEAIDPQNLKHNNLFLAPMHAHCFKFHVYLNYQQYGKGDDIDELDYGEDSFVHAEDAAKSSYLLEKENKGKKPICDPCFYLQEAYQNLDRYIFGSVTKDVPAKWLDLIAPVIIQPEYNLLSRPKVGCMCLLGYNNHAACNLCNMLNLETNEMVATKKVMNAFYNYKDAEQTFDDLNGLHFDNQNAKVNFLGKFSHLNLRKWVGYCSEDREFLLVYEYMQNDSLENHLLKNPVALPCCTRIQSAPRGAQRLAFVHTTKRTIWMKTLDIANKLLHDV